MPALGMAQETGRIVRWLKAEGEAVQAGEILMEIETDKATVEIEAPAAGTLVNVTAAEGEEVPVGRAIALIVAPGEEPPAAEPRRKARRASPVAARIAAQHDVDLSVVQASKGKVEKQDVLRHLEAAPRVPASPKARRLATEAGFDLARASGSGPGGAVLAADVLALAPAGPDEAPEISRLWRIMAERVTQSWTQVPHFYLLREARAERLIAWREGLQRQGRGGVTYTDLLVRLAAEALKAHPRLLASWHDGSIRPGGPINIALAIAVDDGLVAPVIHAAGRLTLDEIAARRAQIVARAREGKVRPEDLQDGAFTISNLGMYAVDAFTAILNTPQAAILAVGRIADRVVAVEGAPAVRPTMFLSLSCDHRVVDGARGAQFLETLVALIEEPLGLLP